MNKNRFSRTTSNINPNSHPHLFIRNSEIAYADITFIEHILAVLSESRVGPGSEYEYLESPRDLPELEPVLFSDLLDDDVTVSFWDARQNGHCRSQHVSKGGTRNAGRHACATFSGTHKDCRSPHVSKGDTLNTNLGRGSP